MQRLSTILYCTMVIAAPLSQGANAETPAAPDRRVLAADYSTHRIAIIAPDGAVEWEHPIDSIHDLQLLPSGNVLFQTTWTRLVEVDPTSGEVVWEYDSSAANGNQGKRVEVHSFQRLPSGGTMIAESGPGRIIEVDSDGSIRHQIALKIDHPDPHRDTRLVRKLSSGNYLVTHEGDGVVREYDSAGNVVWEYAVPLFGKKPRGGHDASAWGNAVFAAERLDSGNTLIATGNGHSVIEVTPEKEIVWHLKQDDVPGVTLAWVTTLQPLANSNLIIGNCHAGLKNPQIVEVTRDKELVWQFKDFERFGDALSNSFVIAPADE